MKKIFTIVLLISLTLTFAWGEGITITSPVVGTVWQTGTKPVISWTSMGVEGNMKIRLFNSAGAKVVDIADNVANNNGGSYNQWEVPQNLEEGRYSVRVKTMNNRNTMDSPLFRIKPGTNQMIINRQLFEKKEVKGSKRVLSGALQRKYYNKKFPDFVITKIFLLADNGLVVNYKNLGKHYSGPLKLRFQIQGLAYITVEKNVSIGPNTVMPFLTGKRMTPNLIALREDGRIMVDAEINPLGDGFVHEIYATGNRKIVYLYYRSQPGDPLRTIRQ